MGRDGMGIVSRMGVYIEVGIGMRRRYRWMRYVKCSPLAQTRVMGDPRGGESRWRRVHGKGDDRN